MTYDQFLESKKIKHVDAGFDVNEKDPPVSLRRKKV